MDGGKLIDSEIKTVNANEAVNGVVTVKGTAPDGYEFVAANSKDYIFTSGAEREFNLEVQPLAQYTVTAKLDQVGWSNPVCNVTTVTGAGDTVVVTMDGTGDWSKVSSDGIEEGTYLKDVSGCTAKVLSGDANSVTFQLSTVKSNCSFTIYYVS